MNVIDALRGAGIVIFIVGVAGAIAYMGDRVGHQVGRKRLTLFNIRPRYTSTIIAVGTGMLIALIVTLVAILASNQVKTAFFHLNEIYSQIEEAQTRERALEEKVTSEHVVVNIDSVMSPIIGIIPLNAPSQLRKDRIHDWYAQTVAYINRAYTDAGLRKFVPPANVDKLLDEKEADSPQVQAWVTQSDVLLFAVADENLYPHDAIHFGVATVADKLIVPNSAPIASLVIPSGKNVSADVALSELVQNYVPREMSGHGMPMFLAANVRAVQTFPDLPQMRTMLTGGSGTYIMTAFAATDVYPHTGGIPVVITLQKAPKQ